MEDGTLKMLGVAALGLLSLYFIYYIFISGQGGAEVSREEFLRELSGAGSVFIISDLRGAPDSAKYGLMQCGVDLAGSVALAPKNVSYFVISGQDCIMLKANASIPYCEQLSKNGTTLYIKYGTATRFYRGRMEIGMQNYSAQMPCSITAKKSQ